MEEAKANLIQTVQLVLQANQGIGGRAIRRRQSRDRGIQWQRNTT